MQDDGNTGDRHACHGEDGEHETLVQIGRPTGSIASAPLRRRAATCSR